MSASTSGAPELVKLVDLQMCRECPLRQYTTLCPHPLLMSGIFSIRNAGRAAHVNRLNDEPAARYRVLVLDDRPAGLAPAIDGLLAGHLEQTGITVNVDAINAPSSALRVIHTNPEAFDRYDAIVAITSSATGLFGSPTALRREAETIASHRPTLLVQVEPAHSRAKHLLQHAQTDADEPAAARTLLVPAGADGRGVARQISAALHELLDPLNGRGFVRSSSSLQRSDSGGVTLRRLQHITRIAREAFELQAVAVNLRVEDTLVTLVASGMAPVRIPFDGSLCAIAFRRPGVTVIADTQPNADAVFARTTQDEAPTRFYAAVAIHDLAGSPIGTFCLRDPRPLEAADLDFGLLVDLALLAEGELIEAPRSLLPTV